MNRAIEPFHGEAFALMTYRCVRAAIGASDKGGMTVTYADGCGHSEVLWNSRDGVTPFILRCPKCAGDLQHVGRDTFSPWYTPKAGQRIFDDMHAEDARHYAKLQTQRFFREHPDDDHITPEELEEIRFADMYGDGVSPMVRTIKRAERHQYGDHGIGYAGLRGLTVVEFEPEPKP